MRISSVIGSESVSARWKSFSNCGVERLGGGGVAELLDAQLGVRLLGGGDGGQRGVDALLGLLQVARAP